MDCPAVRELLAEHVLGTLDEDRRRFVDRHLDWCAGCRKEMAELAEGATVAASALAPAEPPPELEDRVVAAIEDAGGRGERRRRSRMGVAAAGVAALLAVGAFGWALAMAGRVSELRNAALSAADRANQFESVLREILRRHELRELGARGP